MGFQVLKNALFKTIFVLVCASSVVAFARIGPSDGGGTVVGDQGALKDFARFRQLYGDKPFPIDPKRFRLNDKSPPIYDEIRPALDRISYFFPATRVRIDDVFIKPWMVLAVHFPNDPGGQKKVISQKNEAVYVSYDWLKSTSPDRIKEAFLHEAVRNWVNGLLMQTTLLKSADAKTFREYETMFTEALTPPIYQRFPFPLINQTLNELFDRLKNGLSLHSQDFRYYVPNRYEIYKALTASQPRQIYSAICEPIKAVGSPEEKIHTVNTQLMKISNDLNRGFFLPGYQTVHDNNRTRVSLSPGVVNGLALVDVVADAVIAHSTSDAATEILKICPQIDDATVELFQLFEEEGGGIYDPFAPGEVDTLPNRSASLYSEDSAG